MADRGKFDRVKSGDVFIREDLSREYDSDSVSVANGGASPVYYPPGLPMNNTAGATTANLAANAVTGFVLVGVDVPVGGGKVAVIKRGYGVVVNSNALPALDLAGGTYVAADFTNNFTRLNFVLRTEPPKTSVQTT